jgi:hypothetical protein
LLAQLNPPALARESGFIGVPALGAGSQGDGGPALVEGQVIHAGTAAACGLQPRCEKSGADQMAEVRKFRG